MDCSSDEDTVVIMYYMWRRIRQRDLKQKAWEQEQFEVEEKREKRCHNIVPHRSLRERKKPYPDLKRRVWVTEMFQEREREGEFFNVASQLKDDPVAFQNYYKMTTECYHYLLAKLEASVTLGQTNFRKTISMNERLTLLVRYLVTGESYKELSEKFRIAHSTICKIIEQMTSILWEVLQDEFMRIPDKTEWSRIAMEFSDAGYFPNCLGALGGKQVLIRSPQSAGSAYRKTKQDHSIVMLALVDAKCKFTSVDVMMGDDDNDVAIFHLSSLGKLLKHHKLDLPNNAPPAPNASSIPFTILGEEAFPLSRHMLRPYPKRQLDGKKQVFNDRLQHGRQTVERSFGILVSKWGIFERPIASGPDRVGGLIRAACILHNVIREIDEEIVDESLSVPFGCAIVPLSMSNGRGRACNQSTREAQKVRDSYCDFLTGSISEPPTDIFDSQLASREPRIENPASPEN